LESLLSLLLPAIEAHEGLHGLNRHLLVALGAKTRECLLGEIGQRHSHRLSLVAHLSIVELGLNGGWVEFDDLDIAASILQLLSHGEDHVVQSGFRGTVVWTVKDGDKGQAGGRVDNRCLLGCLLLQVRQESLCQTENRRVVGVQFEVHLVEIDAFRLCPVHCSLQTRVHPHAVDIGVLLEDVGRKSWDGLVVGDIEDCGVDIAFGAILLDEFLEVFLSASTDDDTCASLNELFDS